MQRVRITMDRAEADEAEAREAANAPSTGALPDKKSLV
jgi:hypothetical protein